MSGSSDRIDYTAIGDNVNIAARLVGLNKYYESSILGERTDREDLFKRIPVPARRSQPAEGRRPLAGHLRTARRDRRRRRISGHPGNDQDCPVLGLTSTRCMPAATGCACMMLWRRSPTSNLMTCSPGSISTASSGSCWSPLPRPGTVHPFQARTRNAKDGSRARMCRRRWSDVLWTGHLRLSSTAPTLRRQNGLPLDRGWPRQVRGYCFLEAGQSGDLRQTGQRVEHEPACRQGGLHRS